MGSFYSKPKASSYSPSAATVASEPAPAGNTDSKTPSGGESTASTADAQKAAGVVRRKLATVLTSYRGVLDTGSWVPARKSLLGE